MFGDSKRRAKLPRSLKLMFPDTTQFLFFFFLTAPQTLSGRWLAIKHFAYTNEARLPAQHQVDLPPVTNHGTDYDNGNHLPP